MPNFRRKAGRKKDSLEAEENSTYLRGGNAQGVKEGIDEGKEGINILGVGVTNFAAGATN